MIVLKENMLSRNTLLMRCLVTVCFLLSGVWIAELPGQCVSTASFPIPDNDSIMYQFSVSGLIDNNLSSPTQGVCGFEIEFVHQYLGDLTITLISPDGTSVTLIGPQTPSTSPTSLANWNIDFVPCLVPASPDAGFSATWSNDQPWATIGFYTGSYHPFSGCLEDFDSGQANGNWQVIIQDHGEFDLGSIIRMSLIFCNPTGLLCAECNPNAGELSPPNMILCEGENFHTTDLAVDFSGNIPSPAFYNYAYMLVQGNTILQHGPAFSASMTPGQYAVCSINYLRDDSTSVAGLLAGADYEIVQEAVNAGIVCAQLSADCVDIEVLPQPDTVLVTGSICQGETFTYRGVNYTTAGFFYRTFDGPASCDTIHAIRITGRLLTVSTSIPDTLSCGAGTIVLQASATGASGPFVFEWSTIVGNITSSPFGPSVSADQAGLYYVSVTDGICDGEGSVEVMADQAFPQIFAEGGTLTCSQTVVDIHPAYIPTDGNILWTGPSNFTSTTPDISVTIPGTYTIQVTNSLGCTTTREVEVLIDTSTHPLGVGIISKNCANQTIEIGNIYTNEMNAWTWNGPNNFFDIYWRPVVSEPGLYTLTGGFVNGCSRTESYFFDGDFAIPDIQVSPPDTLNCNEVLSISMSSFTPGVAYNWNGPNGFASTSSMIQVSSEGAYIGQVTASNGCVISDTVHIARGSDVFDFQAETDTITCGSPVVEIGVVSPVADQFHWIGFNGSDSLESHILVNATGIYQVEMTDSFTGCKVTANVQVTGDFTSPSYGFVSDTLSCSNPVGTLVFLSSPGHSYQDVFWQLPDMSIVHDVELIIDDGGEYILRVVGSNGCTGTAIIDVPADTIPPLFFLEADSLDCLRTGLLTVVAVDSINSLTWTGPNNFTSNLLNPMVMDSGMYMASGIGLNGCVNQESIQVFGDFQSPDLVIMADSLTCLAPAATMLVQSMDSIVSYTWTDASGVVIGMDSIIMITDTGNYYVTLVGVNHCMSSDSVSIEPLEFPFLQVESDTFTCADTITLLQASTTKVGVSYTWFDFSNNILSLTDEVEVTGLDPVILLATGQNGCETRDTLIIPTDTIRPTAIIDPIGDVRCQNRDAMLDGSESFQGSLSFQWSVIGGNILSDPSQSLIDIQDTGVYTLQVVSLENGCSDTAIFHLQEHPDAIVSSQIEITPAVCTGDHNALIEITSIQGGIEPFVYQINQGVPTSSPFFDGLAAGTFLLTISDSENCIFDTTVIIDQTFDYTVDAGSDFEIYLGETVTLNGLTTLPDSLISNSIWQLSGTMLCESCPTVDITPLETSALQYQVVSETGCIREDQITVFVLEKAQVYIANVFSPNGDGVNDEVRLNAGAGIEKVSQWVIFDRWGNAVYGRTNFDPADPSVYWNGQTTTGEFANPGVFAYVLEVQLISGKEEVLHGEITLLR